MKEGTRNTLPWSGSQGKELFVTVNNGTKYEYMVGLSMLQSKRELAWSNIFWSEQLKIIKYKKKRGRRINEWMVMRRRGLGIHTKQKSEKISSGKKKTKVKLIKTDENDFLY